MQKAEYNDKDLIVDILTKSFDTNQSVNYIVKQDEKKNNTSQCFNGLFF